MNTDHQIRIRPATVEDVPLIHDMIRELAEYERLLDQSVVTQQALRDTLFGPRPAAEVLIAELEHGPAGFALFFQNYSTFLGKPGLYLEDLFIRATARGTGVGKALLAHIARIAVERDYGRVEWAVLDWNKSAIGFYDRIGAAWMNDWRIYRLIGEPLTKLAASCP